MARVTDFYQSLNVNNEKESVLVEFSKEDVKDYLHYLERGNMNNVIYRLEKERIVPKNKVKNIVQNFEGGIITSSPTLFPDVCECDPITTIFIQESRNKILHCNLIHVFKSTAQELNTRVQVGAYLFVRLRDALEHLFVYFGLIGRVMEHKRYFEVKLRPVCVKFGNNVVLVPGETYAPHQVYQKLRLSHPDCELHAFRIHKPRADGVTPTFMYE